MANLAILVGNSTYKNLDDLLCCQNDVEAIRELVEASGRFDFVHSLLDLDAEALKSQLRDAIDHAGDVDELFFYFSGHGSQQSSDFYLCASNFEPKRPNDTGLSNDYLHDLIRPAAPNLVVKIIDACNSGTLLIKRESAYPPVDKSTFKNVIQISSCLNNQVSLSGDPLSEFTLNFCEACINKTEGAIYYTDVIAALRDAYLGNESQTPHFVSQSTGRELFADDARRFDEYRETFWEKWSPDGDGDEGELDLDVDLADDCEVGELVPLPTLLGRLQVADTKLASPATLVETTSAVLDGLKARLRSSEFSAMFDIQTVEHSHFDEPTTRSFIIRVLSREVRRDNFVTAEAAKERKTPLWGSVSAISYAALAAIASTTYFTLHTPQFYIGRQFFER